MGGWVGGWVGGSAKIPGGQFDPPPPPSITKQRPGGGRPRAAVWGPQFSPPKNVLCGTGGGPGAPCAASLGGGGRGLVALVVAVGPCVNVRSSPPPLGLRRWSSSRMWGGRGPRAQGAAVFHSRGGVAVPRVGWPCTEIGGVFGIFWNFLELFLEFFWNFLEFFGKKFQKNPKMRRKFPSGSCPQTTPPPPAGVGGQATCACDCRPTEPEDARVPDGSRAVTGGG